MDTKQIQDLSSPRHLLCIYHSSDNNQKCTFTHGHPQVHIQRRRALRLLLLAYKG